MQPSAGFSGRFEGGRGWYCYPTKQFKTLSVQAFWVNPLRRGEVSRAAVLPYILRRASQKWNDTVAIERELETLYGASFRAEVGKMGDQQLLSFHFEAIHGQFLPDHPDMLAQGLQFLREIVYRPLIERDEFRAETFSQEKELLTRQVEALINDKGQYALSRLIETMAHGQSFGISRYGSVDEVRQLEPRGLHAFYEKLRDHRPMVWMVVGDVDPDQVAEQFAADPHMAHQREALPEIPRFTSHHQDDVVVERQTVQQGKVNLGYSTGITARHPDYPALVMYAGILGGFPHSKLFVHVREEASLAYYAYARLDSALGLMVIGAGIEFEDFDPALAIIHQQVERMQQGEISDEEMDFTLSALTNEILAEHDSPGQIIAGELERLLLGGGLHGQDLIDALTKVTREDVVRVAQGVRLDTTYFLTTDQKPDDQPSAPERGDRQ